MDELFSLVQKTIKESKTLIEECTSLFWEGRTEDLLAKMKDASDKHPKPLAKSHDTLLRRTGPSNMNGPTKIVRAVPKAEEIDISDTSLRDINQRQRISSKLPPSLGQLVQIEGDDTENYGKLVSTMMDGPYHIGIVNLNRPLKGQTSTIARVRFDKLSKFNPPEGFDVSLAVRRAGIHDSDVGIGMTNKWRPGKIK